ncbi:uncharacterized protein [Onthophagus taurus]|uniref:uncharacterized protein n=1 Tax=Onthophagus taurus TaxID=166361 RepID=UPI000C2013B3|nr:uncharacterized protein LOC111426846 [Onthophagus taurus]XP_022917420.1 uncharacterized protein LOC111426846 [Onthophagus taurus]XP_022917421.1 uncharacterized protein LOC111426846 [Onthophagus taurus]XP_022917422.1 uncharacterized protein LOC111426846 [Onthophagus taurus]XP_022917424.1 uncharacterized protein LOC111426846 [Onthophagus taurus]
MVATGDLIKAVERYPVLYDFNHEDYKNIREKDKLWAKIGCQIKSNGKIAKNKWKNLKDTYAKYLKTHKNGTARKTKWLWADDMKWFKPYLSYPELASYIVKNERHENNEPSTHYIEPVDVPLPEATEDSSEESPSDSTHSMSNNDPLRASSSNETVKKSKIVKCVAQSSSSVETMIGRLENKITIELDAIDTLFLAHAKTIKSFPPRRQIKAKMRIAEVIMDEELENLGESK